MNDRINEIPADNLYVETFRSEGSRRQFLAAVLVGKPHNRDEAETKLLKKYRKEIAKRLPQLSDAAQFKLANEIVAADAPYFKETLDVEVFREVVNKKPLVCLQPKRTVPAPSAQSQTEAHPPSLPEFAPAINDAKTMYLSEEVFVSWACALALDHIEGFRFYHPKRAWVGPRLMESLQAKDRNMSTAAAEKLIAFLKEKAGTKFVAMDDDNDIPF